MSRHEKTNNKCEQNQQKTILTCVRRLAPIASPCSALPSVCGGSKRLRKKEIIFFINYIFYIEKTKNKEMTHTKKPSPDTGKVSTFRLTEGASVSRNERIKICMSKNKKIKKWIMRKSCPRLTGKVAAIAVGRGKREQTRKNK